MCLIAFAWNAHPRWRLLLLANRDEFHARPAAPLACWNDAPQVLAGRDLEAGGTWLGANVDGRVATVTNVRDPASASEGKSRGLLVADYLRHKGDAAAWIDDLRQRAAGYRPFNLLCFERAHAWYVGNHPEPGMQSIPAGVHGLSNADFNTPWPKTRALMDRLTGWIERGETDFAPLWNALADPGEWPEHVLPDTGIGIERERRLSAAFIRGREYGTRASSLVSVDHCGHVRVMERRFGPGGACLGATVMTPGACGA